jgi:uncharacterized membrane protein HdeD (DUF308 family)
VSEHTGIEDGSVETPGLEATGRSLEIAGVLVGLLGVLGVLFPYAAGVSISLLLGVTLVAGALVHVANAFRTRGWKGFAGQVLLAVVYAVAGVGLLANPTLGVTTLTVLLIAFLLVSGVFEVAVGIQLRGDPRWGVAVASGALSVVLGVLLWAGFPGTAAWALGLVVGLSLLSTGLSMIFIGRSVHRMDVRGETGTESFGE